MSEFKTKAGTLLPLMDIRGKGYLQVPQRIIWFREEHPDWSIETSIVDMAEDHTVFRAVIRDQSGHLMATAHQREDKKDFADHLAKAETAAVGRALSYCGYGTAFALELETGDRIADAPIKPSHASRSGPNSVAVATAQAEGPLHWNGDPMPQEAGVPPWANDGASLTNVPPSGLTHASVANVCGLCGADLKVTKSGNAKFCPNFKDKSRGEHTYLKLEQRA